MRFNLESFIKRRPITIYEGYLTKDEALEEAICEIVYLYFEDKYSIQCKFDNKQIKIYHMSELIKQYKQFRMGKISAANVYAQINPVECSQKYLGGLKYDTSAIKHLLACIEWDYSI